MKQTPVTYASRMSELSSEGAYAVLSEAQALERQGKSIIHLEIGQPDFETPKHIVQSAITALRSGKTKYSPSLGILPLRQQLAKTASKFRNIDIDARQVAVTPSGKTAIFAVMALLLNPGDEVIYPDPGFPTYRTLISFFGAKAMPIPLVENNHFSFDMAVFRKSFTKKTRLVILNSPGNPTGGVIPKKDFIEIAGMVRETHAFVMTDEMYSQIIYSKEPYHSIYSLPRMKERTFIVDGFSKTYAMTGWRLGYLIAPELMIEKMDYLLTHTVGCTATFIQEAGIAALLGSHIATRSMVDEFRKRRDYVIDQLNRMDGVRCELPDGAFYAFPNVSSFHLRSKQLASYLLNTGGVALLDGTSFGDHGEGYLRISYATSMNLLEEGLRRIKMSLRSLQ